MTYNTLNKKVLFILLGVLCLPCGIMLVLSSSILWTVLLILALSLSVFASWVHIGISLESITLPDTLEELYCSCFESCLSLESITLPKGLKKFPERAFLGCKSLQGIALPDGITEIPEDAFKD